MAKDPEDRYQTASELGDAARAALTSPRATRATQPPTRPVPQSRPSATTAKSKRANEQRRAAAKRKLEAELAARRRRKLMIAGSAAAAVTVIVAIVLIVVVTKDHQTDTTTPTAGTTSSAGSTNSLRSLPAFQPSASLGADCQYPKSQEPAAKPIKPPRSGKIPTEPATVSVSMFTTQGNIGLLLANNESPCTVNSFVSLASQGFFNDTKCHRLTTSPALAVLQCGDPKGDGTGGPGYQFGNEYPTDQYPLNDPKLEQPVVYPRGTLAMARSQEPNSNGSQFFMVYRDSQLPPNYTVFGKIQNDGLATLDKIAKAGLADGGMDGKPVAETIIKSVLLD